MKIEVIDLRKRFQEEKTEILKLIKNVLLKGNLVLTKEVDNFEKKNISIYRFEILSRFKFWHRCIVNVFIGFWHKEGR